MRCLAIVLCVAAASCRSPESNPPPLPPPADTWLRGLVDERFATVATQLRGFDVAMVEVGYRYGELTWAGRDRNWPYAAYQLEKIETAIRNGVVRRPKRGASARMIEEPLAQLRAAAEQHDPVAFDTAFATLTTTCNACHVAEQVAFVQVAPPVDRRSPVVAPTAPTR